MNYTNYTRLRSSWSPDRVAACDINRLCKPRSAQKLYFYAAYCGKEVKVCNSRGSVRFTLSFDRKVVSALVRDGRLEVVTGDDCVRLYDVLTSRLLAENWPTPPQGGSAKSSYSLAA